MADVFHQTPEAIQGLLTKLWTKSSQDSSLAMVQVFESMELLQSLVPLKEKNPFARQFEEADK